MRNKINKEKEGLTVRFSVRLPKEQHAWLKKLSQNSKENTGMYISMNEYISEAVDFLKNKYVK